MRIPRKATLLLLLALIIVGFYVWVAVQPRPTRPDVSVSLLGYTTDNSGVRLAIIAVTNLSSFPALVYLPTIQIKAPNAPQGFTNYFEGNTNQWRRFHSMLAAGEGGSFTIPPPAITLSSWRLSFYAYSDFGVAQVLRRFVHGRQMPFEVTSDWFEGDK
jgi:hypothetical protein